MTDTYTTVSLAIASVALVISALTWFESRKRSELTKSIAESLKFIASNRRKTKGTTDPEAHRQKLALQQQAEERRKLKVRLQEQKQAWDRQKDVVKALGWLIDRIGEDDQYDE